MNQTLRSLAWQTADQSRRRQKKPLRTALRFQMKFTRIFFFKKNEFTRVNKTSKYNIACCRNLMNRLVMVTVRCKCSKLPTRCKLYTLTCHSPGTHNGHQVRPQCGFQRERERERANHVNVNTADSRDVDQAKQYKSQSNKLHLAKCYTNALITNCSFLKIGASNGLSAGEARKP